MKLTKNEKEAIQKALNSKGPKGSLCPFEGDTGIKICVRCHKLMGTKRGKDPRYWHPCDIIGVREVVRRARKLLEEQA